MVSCGLHLLPLTQRGGRVRRVGTLSLGSVAGKGRVEGFDGEEIGERVVL